MRIGRRSSGRRPAPAVDPAVDSTPAAPRADVGLRGRLPVVYPTVIAVAYISILYVTSGASIFSAVRLLLVTIIATYLVTALLTAIFRDRDRGGLATTGLVLAFLLGADPKQALPGLALMLVVVLDALLARSRPSRLPWHTITRVGTAIATVLFLAVAIKGVSEGLPGRIAEDWSTEGPFRPNATAAADPAAPDVYAILLDGYLRPDKQLSIFGHDDGAFVAALEARGFAVSDHSRSNYLATDASLSSMFNMRHLAEMRDPSMRDDLRTRRLIGGNEAFARFRAAGYQTVSIGPGFEMVTDRAVDQFIDTGQINELELVAISSTLLRPLIDAFAPDLLADQFRSRVTANLEAVADVASQATDRPRLVFAHVPSPHDPIVFDAQGRPIPAEIRPGRTIQGPTLTRAEYGALYTGQVDYLNTLTLAAIDRIQAAGGRAKVILVFSDHGSASGLDWGDLEHSDLDERTADLVAVAMPDGSDPLGEDITLVNVFGRLIGAVLGESVPTQPDTSYRFDGGLFDLQPIEVPR